VALTLLLPAPVPAESADDAHLARDRCHGNIRTVHVRRLARALLCLHNRERRAHGLRGLRPSRTLAHAARRHAGDMVRRHYFDHLSRRGRSPFDRAGRAGYGGRRVTVGENLYYRLVPLPTPSEVMAAWMASPGHRQQILNPRFRELGIGTVMRPPLRGQRGITVVAELGARG
jgi:uncharacterized protein YkwD